MCGACPRESVAGRIEFLALVNTLALLVRAREDAGVSPSNLAARFGLLEDFVLSYECGQRLLDPAEFIAIARAIGVDPYELPRRAEGLE